MLHVAAESTFLRPAAGKDECISAFSGLNGNVEKALFWAHALKGVLLCCALSYRQILVSVKFVSAILGPEMPVPILWAPGNSAFFLQENLCP